MTYRFGPFVADRTMYRVSRDRRALDMTPKLLDLLFYFLERPATLITKEALLDGVWPGANVTDNALAQAISDLRDALADEPSAPVYIRTVARRGYRFVAAVEVDPSDTSPRPRPAATTDPTREERAPAGVTDGPRAIAVLDFANVGGETDVAWLAAGIAETVTSDLAALGQFKVIDRWRVAQMARRTDGSLHEIAATLGSTLLGAGSFQRSGSILRITARIIDLASGEAVADAKVDGPLRDAFSLQDSIVTTFARELHLPATAVRLGVRETSNLEAYRAYTEGWLKIESLDTDLTSASIRDFERAIALDPRYAIAYAGLANAEFVAYEMTRVTRQPNVDALASGIEHARHAIRLDDQLAEAHATLSFLLVSAMQLDEARASAQRAVSIEPDSWRHEYRLGHASWGDTRVRAFTRALALYPQFAYANFELAMVHVARGRLDDAEDVVRRGVAGQDRLGHSGDRFPAIGFHWLLGALRFARGDHEGALAEFERELAQYDRRRLYGTEYAAVALESRGHAQLALDAPQEAIASFRGALTYVEGYARAHLGLAAALARVGDHASAAAARQDCRGALERMPGTERAHEALLIGACDAALHEGREPALAWLDRLLDAAPPSFVGWTLPIEPLLQSLHGHPGFTRLLARLADQAK